MPTKHSLVAGHHAQLARDHGVEALIASDVLTPADVFVAELEARGLLVCDDGDQI